MSTNTVSQVNITTQKLTVEAVYLALINGFSTDLAGMDPVVLARRSAGEVPEPHRRVARDEGGAGRSAVGSRVEPWTMPSVRRSARNRGLSRGVWPLAGLRPVAELLGSQLHAFATV